MKINKVALLIAFAITSVLFMEVVAHADEADQYTKITFNQAIEIPGKVLPAGTYLFKLESPDNRSLVQILSADGSHMYATLQTIAADRRKPTGHTVVILAEQPDGKPETLLEWFYPGDTIGHEFVYSKQEERQLAQDRQQTVTADQTAQAAD